ncbi:MAG: bifunctional glutamine synthetase adenylyltransferase/deadenyltransferase, partial [Spongiibacteraceae bacterium]
MNLISEIIIEQLPAILQRDVQLAIDSLLEACNETQRADYVALLSDPAFAAPLLKLFAGSQFCAQICRRYPDWLLTLQRDGDLKRALADSEWRERLGAFIARAQTADDLDRALRQFRNREYLRILWRDFNRLCDMAATTADITRVAEVCIQKALDFHYTALAAEFGVPTSADGSAQQLVVLGMGKLGARELNLSSDIDLIFAYPASGHTVSEEKRDGPRSIHNQEFFSHLGKRLIQSLDRLTADGFVFRVDMRLRPYGESGALVLNFDAMEEYYQDQGRDWERYAMIKARVVAG